MFDVVYEFLGIAELACYPVDMSEMIPYLLRFLVASVLTMAVFKVISHISGFFFNWKVMNR